MRPNALSHHYRSLLDQPLGGQFLLAIGLVLLSLLLRWLLSDVLEHRMPFLLTLAVLLPLVLLVRPGPFFTAAVVGWVGAVYLFLPRQMSMVLEGTLEVTAACIYAGVMGLAGTAAWLSSRRMASREQAQEAVRSSEQFQAGVLNSLPAEVAVLDGQGRIIAVNDPWRRFVGTDGGGLVPDTVGVGSDYLGTCREAATSGNASAQQAHDGLKQVLQAERDEFTIDYPCHASDEQRWFRLHVVRASEAIGGAVVVHTNISKAKGDEQALAQITNEAQQQQRLYETILSNTPDLVYVFDLNHRFIYANDALLKMWGRSWAESNGKSLLEIGYEPWHAEMHEREIDDVVATRQPVRGEVPFDHHTLGRRMYDYILVPIVGPDGEVEAVGGTTRDVTDRLKIEESLRESENLARVRAEELEALLDSVPAVVWIAHDPACRKITGNRKAYEFFRLPAGANLSKRLDAVGSPATFRVYQDGVELPIDQLPAQRAVRGERIDHEEIEVRFEDGAVGYLLGNSIPLYDSDGQIRGSLSALVDITERKRAEQQLEQLNQTLEQRVVERTAEAEQRARQLQILAAELTVAEQRERRKLAQLLHDDLQQILVAANMQLVSMNGGDAAVRAKELLGQAIDTSRLLSSELAPPVLGDLGLGPALQWLARWAGEKYGLKVELELNEPRRKISDSLQQLLFQAVRELLLNVVKHAQTNEACVVLKYSAGDVRIRVEDTGRGFDAQAVKAHRTGEGFGLFSLSERVELLGGWVSIDSETGRGTTVELMAPLPTREPFAAEPPTTDAPASDSPVAASRPASGPLRVLLTDDHEIVRRGFAQLIEQQEDMTLVGEAESGEQAVEKARALRPDVVVMDITLPGISGIEATRLITRELPGTRVIGLSMHEVKDVATAMYAAGAVEYLSKAGHSEQLLKAIRSSVSTKQEA